MTSLTLRSAASSPYRLVSASTPTQPSPQNKRGLLMMSRIAEAQTLSSPQGAVVLAVLQESQHYTDRTARSYRLLANRGVQVLLFAHGWDGVIQPQPGLRLIGLAPDDAARDEWDVLVCSPRRRFGFVSLDTCQPFDHEMERTFAWLTTRDSAGIDSAADALLQRVPTLPIRLPTLVA